MQNLIWKKQDYHQNFGCKISEFLTKFTIARFLQVVDLLHPTYETFLSSHILLHHNANALILSQRILFKQFFA